MDLLWSIECREGSVALISKQRHSISPIWWTGNNTHVVNCQGSLVLPSLCHPHVHLDKCFILGKCGRLQRGNFDEAMKLTGKAKASFPQSSSDLYSRGARLVTESLECGVTSMRAHIEVDTIVGLVCFETGLRLKEHFDGACEVQIAVFAQEPLFLSPTDNDPGPNFDILQTVASNSGVAVIGSAPYVEPTIKQAKQNIRLILELASMHGLHADFHLDYNIDSHTEPLIHEVIAQVRQLIGQWRSIDETAPQPRITIGHASRLQLFSPSEWRRLIADIGDLPISFVGLPQSDMYMLGGEGERKQPLGSPRSTLRVPSLARDYGLQVAMGVNNVDNPFTPQGSLDPLSLCTFGVAVFQAATTEDIEALALSVTSVAKTAVGLGRGHTQLFPSLSQPADFVILHDNQNIRSAILNPSYDRTTICAGRIVSQRRTHKWIKLARNEKDIGALSWYRHLRWLALLGLLPSYALFRYYKSK
ncbi:hypothetical protein HGRIS_006032 [Hohenbuehelia grisea]